MSAAGARGTAGGAGLARHVGVLAAVIALGLGGAALAGCGGDDDDETAATTPATTTTEAEAKEHEGPSGSEDTEDEQPGDNGVGDDVAEPDPTPADTGPPVPESGGVGVDDTSEPEEDTEENDVPPPPGSSAEAFEQACDADPELCD